MKDAIKKPSKTDPPKTEMDIKTIDTKQLEDFVTTTQKLSSVYLDCLQHF